MASVVKIELNAAFDTDTFQVELVPGTQLTDRRERDGMQPTVLRTQMLINGNTKSTTEVSEEPSHETNSP